jgi:hypothetical protein
MSSEDWLRVKEILADAIERDPEARAAFLDQACGQDGNLRREVEKRLLYASADADPESTVPPKEITSPVGREQLCARGAETPSGAVPQIHGYTILDLVGEGGMGTVWRATQLELNRTVAIKLMLAQTIGSIRARKRFRREIELAACFEHEHIARVYDSGNRDGVYYYSMELVNGLPIDEYVRQAGLSRTQVLQLMLRVCRAVQYAHGRGVIHRDLKPSNILVTPDGQPKLLDFGLAKSLTHDDQVAAITFEGEISGTPGYMAPEQAQGGGNSITLATDVYALGVILYRLLLNQPPMVLTGNLREDLNRISEGDIVSPTAVDPKLDGEIQSILLKALNAKPAERYSSAGALAADLDRFLRGETILAQPQTTFYILKKRYYRYRYYVAAVALAMMLSIAGVTFHIIRIQEERQALRKALIEKEGQRQRAESNAEKATAQRAMALKLVNDLVYKAQRELTEPGEQQKIRKLLIDFAREGLQRLATESDAITPLADRTAAATCIKDGDRLAKDGEFAAARAQYQMALNMLEKLKKDGSVSPHNLKHDEVIARCSLARLNLGESRRDDARSEFGQAAVLVGELRADQFDAALLDRDLWAIEIGLGDIELAQSRPDAALERFRRAEQYLPAPSRDQVVLKRRMFRGLLLQYEQTGDALRLSQAMTVIERVIADCRSVHSRLPEDRRAALDLAGSLREWAMGLRHQQRSADANAAEDEASQLLAALGGNAPATVDDPQAP